MTLLQDRFHEKTWGQFTEATKFHSENGEISISLPTSNAKPSFDAELASGTYLQSSTICQSFALSHFEEINEIQMFQSSQTPQD